MSLETAIEESGKIPEGKSFLAVLAPEGDLKTIWDKNNPEEVEQARKTFNEFRAKGYLAWNVKKNGEKNEQIFEFRPNVEAIILSPPLRGG